MHICKKTSAIVINKYIRNSKKLYLATIRLNFIFIEKKNAYFMAIKIYNHIPDGLTLLNKFHKQLFHLTLD